MTDFEEAREFFSGDFYATKSTGIVIDEVGNHYARCSMEITRKHQNAYGGVMGGATFTLADYTFAVASNFRQPQTVSVTSQINFIGMAKGTKLISESHLIRDGRSTCLYSIDITDDLGTKIAYVTMKIIEIHIISLNFRFYMHDYRNLWIFVFISLFYTDNTGYFRDFIRIFMLISLKISAFGRFCAYNFAIFSFLYAFFPVFLILYRNLKKIYG